MLIVKVIGNVICNWPSFSPERNELKFGQIILYKSTDFTIMTADAMLTQ